MGYVHLILLEGDVVVAVPGEGTEMAEAEGGVSRSSSGATAARGGGGRWSLQGMTALVTGGTRGIGSAAASPPPLLFFVCVSLSSVLYTSIFLVILLGEPWFPISPMLHP